MPGAQVLLLLMDILVLELPHLPQQRTVWL